MKRSNIIDVNKFNERMKSFPTVYMDNFNYVWEWKIETEKRVDSILNNSLLPDTHYKLSKILNKWQTYRNGDNADSIGTLKIALQNISEPYKEIKNITLLEFDEIPHTPLEIMWHELGRVKEKYGSKNDSGFYSIISICKPLLLLWGQTLAFDSNVRRNLADKFGVPKNQGNWTFNQWIDIMNQISEALKSSPECISIIEKESHQRYGKDSPVPYGRFLDIYFFEGA